MPAGQDALQALLAFSALHDQVRQQRNIEKPVDAPDPAKMERFALDEVLQLVAERAAALTGADGVAIALAEGDAIVCRAATGEIAPDTKAKLNPNSGFSGVCFRTGKIVRCDDAENDPRVNVQAARRLGVRSMVAVPLTGKRGTLGLLEAFSSKAFGFDDADIRKMNLLAELILAAMKPEEESRMAEISQQLTAAEVEEPVAAARVAWPIAEPPPARTEVPVVEDKPAEVSVGCEAAPASEEVLRQFLPEPARGNVRPGVRLVALLIGVALVLGIGLWWTLHSRQGSTAIGPAPPSTVQPQPISVTATNVSLPQEPITKIDGLTSIMGIRQWSSPDSTTSTVVIDLADQVQYEDHPRLTDPERVYFDLHDTALPRSLAKTIEVGDALLVRVRVGQPNDGVTRVVLETKNSPNYSVSLEQNPYRLVLQVRSAAAQPKARVDLFAPATRAPEQHAASQPAIRVVPTPAPTLKAETTRVHVQVPKFRIVLDAGHGGWDEGTIGRRGLMEKDLALDVVSRLGKLLADRAGADIVYTRTDDSYIALEKRAEIANMSQADLFVSIHANYSDFPSARGVETYYTNTYSSLNARTPNGDPTLETVNWTNVDIREKAQQSQRLAASVQKSLFGKLAQENPGMRDRGVKKASYVVLTGTTMPAILAEVSFMSSPTDEKSLKSAAYRQQIAEALYRGISRFATDHHKVTMASASPKSSGR
jgi:N-acetylmuramoyl-L-alanine amidase